MANKNDDGGSFEESSSEAFHHNPWPYVSPARQHELQNRFFEDGATIHFERLRGLPFWAPIFFFPDETRVRMVVGKVVGAAQKADRRLTAEEIDVVSEYADASTRKLYWSHPVSAAFAVAATVKDRRIFKFPFYQPKMQAFDPFYFPTRSMPLVKGPRAHMHWHFLRFLSYSPFTWIASVIFFSSVADMSYQAHIFRDPRLTKLVKDMKQSAANASQNLQRQTQSAMKAPPQEQVDYSSSQVPPPSQSQWYPQSQAVRNGTASTPRHAQGAASQAPPQKYGEPTPPDHPSGNANWDSDPFEDDASPVAPSARRAEAAQTQSSNNGSVWARLRQKSQSEASSFAKGDSSGQERGGWAQLRQDKAPNTTTDGARSTDRYSYSPQDEEREKRNYEKEQAQKEFDALLEAERRGESSSGRRR